MLPAMPWTDNRRLSIEQFAETGKMEPAGNSGPGDAERGRSMATKLMPKKSGGKKTATKKASPKKAAANGPAMSAEAELATRAKLPSKTAAAIWSRIVKPDQATFTPELARTILKLKFDAEDHRRVEELSTKAQKGTLTAEERAELDEYIRVGNQLAVLQSKARLSLKRANQSP
jgi:hypothetical protein